MTIPFENFRQATESEGEAFRMSEPEGQVSEMYRGGLKHAVKKFS